MRKKPRELIMERLNNQEKSYTKDILDLIIEACSKKSLFFKIKLSQFEKFSLKFEEGQESEDTSTMELMIDDFFNFYFAGLDATPSQISSF